MLVASFSSCFSFGLLFLMRIIIGRIIIYLGHNHEALHKFLKIMILCYMFKVKCALVIAGIVVKLGQKGSSVHIGKGQKNSSTEFRKVFF